MSAQIPFRHSKKHNTRTCVASPDSAHTRKSVHSTETGPWLIRYQQMVLVRQPLLVLLDDLSAGPAFPDRERVAPLAAAADVDGAVMGTLAFVQNSPHGPAISFIIHH